jgi:hypothetical protein
MKSLLFLLYLEMTERHVTIIPFFFRIPGVIAWFILTTKATKFCTKVTMGFFVFIVPDFAAFVVDIFQ